MAFFRKSPKKLELDDFWALVLLTQVSLDVSLLSCILDMYYDQHGKIMSALGLPRLRGWHRLSHYLY